MRVDKVATSFVRPNAKADRQPVPKLAINRRDRHDTPPKKLADGCKLILGSLQRILKHVVSVCRLILRCKSAILSVRPMKKDREGS